MPTLYGKSISKSDLMQRVGLIGQVGGVRRVTLAEGNERGVEAVEFRTGSGLSFTVLAGRGMDISTADYRGRALNWRSATGDAAASFFEPQGLGWLRTFYGGLLMTCGMTWAGAPCTDEDEELGLHGRASHIPATNVAADGEWRGEEYWMWARGKVREAVVFGANILLEREISCKLGESTIHIRDVVTNEGFSTQPHMYLYHINLGYPVVSGESELLAPSKEVKPRDDWSAENLDTHSKFSAPIPDLTEMVYYHDLATEPDGTTYVAMVNRGLDGGFGVGLKFNKNEFTRFTQWKMPGQGTYVTGLEPCNCHVEGRDVERERGTLQHLEPGESREYHMEISVLANGEEVGEFEAKVRALSP